MLNEEQQKLLLSTARRSISHTLEHGDRYQPLTDNCDPALLKQQPNFVTLMIGPDLRGCIGSTEKGSPLLQSIAEHAYAAAFSDPRFQPLSKAELDRITISISILTPNEEIQFDTEEDLLRQLRPGIDGLIIAKQNRKATFLPSVWESLKEPRDFLNQLKLKARMDLFEIPDQAWCYQSESFSE